MAWRRRRSGAARGIFSVQTHQRLLGSGTARMAHIEKRDRARNAANHQRRGVAARGIDVGGGGGGSERRRRRNGAPASRTGESERASLAWSRKTGAAARRHQNRGKCGGGSSMKSL